jgi:hypothetical protein
LRRHLETFTDSEGPSKAIELSPQTDEVKVTEENLLHLELSTTTTTTTTNTWMKRKIAYARKFFGLRNSE